MQQMFHASAGLRCKPRIRLCDLGQESKESEAFTVKISMRAKLLWLVCVSTAACLAISGGTAIIAQTIKPGDAKGPAVSPKPAASEDTAPKAHELTAEDLGAFLDGFMPQQIEHADIAGAV